jgi:hypothetical protein
MPRRGRASKKAAEDIFMSQQAVQDAAAAAAAQAEQEAEAAAAQAQAAAAAAAGLGHSQLALTTDGYQQQYTLEGLPAGAGLVYYVSGIPGERPCSWIVALCKQASTTPRDDLGSVCADSSAS